jgi:hypothetical protein
VTKWDKSIEEYLKKVSDSGGPTYQTEPIQGSYADEALRQGKRISDGTANMGAPYLDYNYAYFKKGDNLFVLQHTQNPGMGCLVPTSPTPFIQKSNLDQQEYNTIFNNYSSYSPENYLRFSK